MPGNLWTRGTEDSDDDIRRPDSDASFGQLTEGQKAIVLDYIENTDTVTVQEFNEETKKLVDKQAPAVKAIL